MKHIKKRKEIKRILEKLEPSNRSMFSRLYSPHDLEIPINEVVDTMPDGQISWALIQVKNSYHSIITVLGK
jgi:hypothetical protein